MASMKPHGFDNESDDPEFQDAFVRGFEGIPSDQELQAMSYAELAVLLSSCTKGSAKYLVVERAKMHRDVFELPVLTQAIPKVQAEPAPDHWYKKRIPVIGSAVLAA